MTTEQTTNQTTEQRTIQTIKSDPTTSISNNDEYSSMTTTTSLQTTDSLQSTKMRTKEDTIAHDQITGNIISINVMNRHTMLKLTKIFTKTCITNRGFAISKYYISAGTLTIGWMIPRGIIVHHQRYRSRDSNTNLDIQFSADDALLE